MTEATWTPVVSDTPVWTPAEDDDLTFTARGTLSSDAVTVPDGTMPLVEGFYAPDDDKLTSFLTATDDALTGAATGIQTVSTNLTTEIGDREEADGLLDARLDVLEGQNLDGRLDVLEASDTTNRAEELARAEATERTATLPTFALCAPETGGDHHDHAWEHPCPGNYTTGAWARFDDLVVLPYPDVAPSPTTERTYSEIATQTHDAATTTPPEDPGRWDNEEDAVEREWSTTNGTWRHWLFYEWTEIGGEEEAHGYSTDGVFELVLGVPYTIVRHLEFNVGGNWRLRWFRRVWHETPTHQFDGADWVLIQTITGTGATSIDTDVTDPWGYGYGQGALYCRRITKRDAGPTGTLMARLYAPDAAAAEDGEFTDGAGNTVTPGAEAATYTPSTGGGGGVSLGETSTTAYRGDRGKTAYDYSQSHTGATDPHGDRAYAAALVDDLSGVTNASTARTNLGLGTLATLSAIPNNGVRVVERDAYLWDTASSGSETFTVDTATHLGGGFTTGEALNDYIEYVDWLDAGTWELTVWHTTSTAAGVFTLTLDGGAAIGATVDGYTGSTVRNNRVTRTGISVSTSGLHTLRIAMLSKNGSSSGYRSGIQAYAWRRTA